MAVGEVDQTRRCRSTLSEQRPQAPAMTSSTPTEASAMIDFADLAVQAAAGPDVLAQGHRQDGHPGAHRIGRGRLHQGGGRPVRERSRRGWDDPQGQGRRGRHSPSHLLHCGWTRRPRPRRPPPRLPPPRRARPTRSRPSTSRRGEL